MREPIEFTIFWTTGTPRVIGRDFIKRHDLTDAITAACNMLKAGKGNSDYAAGFYVRSGRHESGN